MPWQCASVSFGHLPFVCIECQTETTAVQNDPMGLQLGQLQEEKKKLEDKILHQVLSEELLSTSDQLTRFYTGFANYGAFHAFVDYISPKALRLKSKRSQHSSSDGDSSYNNASGPKPWSSLSIGDQLLCVLAKLRLGVPSLDIATRVGISVATFSRLFSIWIPFLSCEL